MLLECGHRFARTNPDGAPSGEHPLRTSVGQDPASDVVDCADCVALTLPVGARHYRSTPEFTRETLPAGLRRDHRTRAGTWGVIEVFEGEIEYFVTGPFTAARHLRAGQNAAIPPEATHYVRFATEQGAVRMRVDFYRLPPTG